MSVAIPSFPPKDPGARLDYTFDFTNLLEENENIIAINTVVISPTPTTPLLVNEGSVILPGGLKVTVVLSGGKPCTEYTITVNVTTDVGSPARIFERSGLLKVKDQ